MSFLQEVVSNRREDLHKESVQKHLWEVWAMDFFLEDLREDEHHRDGGIDLGSIGDGGKYDLRYAHGAGDKEW